MPDLQRYPLKLWMIKYELDIHVLVSLNWLFSFKASLQKWFARFFLEEMQKSSENDSIFLIFIRVRDLKNSGKYGSGVSCRWVLFTALAFKFKLHLIFHRVEFNIIFKVFSWKKLTHFMKTRFLWKEDFAAFNHMTEAVVRVESKIGS